MRDAPCDEEQGDELPAPVVPQPLAHVCILARGKGKVIARGHVLPGRRRECGGNLADARGGTGGICGILGGEKGRPQCIEGEGIKELKDDIHGDGGCCCDKINRLRTNWAGFVQEGLRVEGCGE